MVEQNLSEVFGVSSGVGVLRAPNLKFEPFAFRNSIKSEAKHIFVKVHHAPKQLPAKCLALNSLYFFTG